MIDHRYLATDPSIWTGRIDGETYDVFRWHQKMQVINLEQEEMPVLKEGESGVAIVGFMCDEGVKRNNGRVGAVDGPYEMRKVCANLPVHFPESVHLLDLGNIQCNDEDLEGAQEALGKVIEMVLTKGYRPLVWGGGHEIAYAHYLGVNAYMNKVHRITSYNVCYTKLLR